MRPTALAVLAALAGCGAPRDIGWVDEGLKVCAKGPTVEGVDVSHWDGNVDWAALKAANVEFAFIKATENVNFTDPQFAANWQATAQNGIARGAYHFFRPEVDPTAQADYFVKVAGAPGPGDLPPTLDLEVTDNVAGATVAARALTFLARVQQTTGRTPIVYTSASFMASIGNPKGFDAYVLWVANWGVQCPNIPSPPWNDWAFWQYTDMGGMGVGDRNRWNGTLADLQAFCNPALPDGGADASPADAAPTDGASDGARADASPLDLARGDLAHAIDAARPDLAAAAPAPGGCGCAVGGRAPAPPLALAAAALAIAALARSLRRARATQARRRRPACRPRARSG